MLCPPRPIALETSSNFKNTSALFVSSLILIEETLAGLNALVIYNWMLLVKLITSIFSFPNSRTIPWIREPFIPTQAPTGSILSS